MDNIDFLPQRIRDSRRRKKRLQAYIALLVLCAVVLTGIGWHRQGKVAEASAQLTALQEKGQGLTLQNQQRQELESQLRDLMLKKKIENKLGCPIGPQMVLAELQQRMPPTVSLNRLDLEVQEIQPKPAAAPAVRQVAAGIAVCPETIKRLRLTITGVAPDDDDLANFIGQLSASPLLEDVNMGYSRNIVVRGKNAREFLATCFIAR